MINQWQKQLKETLDGEVRFDPISKKIYSIDASIFEIEPLGVVLPKHLDDVIQTIKIAKNHQIPIIPRGAATGITGGCIGKGIILDTSKYLNKIIAIDYQNEWALVEPGVVQDHLNAVLDEQGYCLGPETSTGNRATIGGMVANNAAGSRSLLFGTMVDHVMAVEMVLSSAEVVEFSKGSSHFTNEMLAIIDQYKLEIQRKFPNIPRRVSGYNLNELLNSRPLNLAKLITGSEGTLGVMTKIKIKISKKPTNIAQCLIFFDQMTKAFQAVPKLLKNPLIALEMVDETIIDLGKKSPSMKGKLDWLPEKNQNFLIAEMQDKDLKNFEANLIKEKIGNSFKILTNEKSVQNVRTLRKSGLGLLLSKRSYKRAIAFIEDLSIAPDHLSSFMEQFLKYMEREKLQAGIYGHVGSGCMHIRPFLDLEKEGETDRLQRIMNDVAELVKQNKGALSGEHGDGLIRSWLNKKMFGETLTHAFLEVKQIFDPDNLMNPGKIIDGPFPKMNLKKSPKKNAKTFLNFDAEGGFTLSVDLCNGNGQCRKKEGLMCPSYQATQDEYDTTRARAQSLKALLRGEIPKKEQILDILDLCLGCKGCKTECPSQVDMAKMKAEILHSFGKKTIRDNLLANISTIYYSGSFFPTLFNYTSQLKWLKSAFRLSTTCQIPSLAKTRFSKWFQHYRQPKLLKTVVLFNDTFTEFTSPEIGKATVRLLNALGYFVIVPKWQCCGRPLISKGFLDKAKKKATALTCSLLPYTHLPIIGIEPSCILTIKDDFPSLTGFFDLTTACLTLDEFLQNQIQNGNIPLPWKNREKQILVHGHCYQKSLIGIKPTLDVLSAIPGFSPIEIPSGCCGMAGSFGYEIEHEKLSKKIGELHLLPAIRSASNESIILANGISCRSQIASETKRRGKHLAEVLLSQLRL